MDDRNHLSAPNDEDDGAELKSPEDAADRFGIRAALLVTCIGFLIAAIWLLSSPSFQKCSAFENVKDRIACYEGLRSALLTPPAK
jgi:hypothetical protein